MENLLEKLLEAVELGKVDKKSPYPPQLKDRDRAYELAGQALEQGFLPDEILENALIPAKIFSQTFFKDLKLKTLQ